MYLDLSVVIPVSNDLLIDNCLKSINENVEVVVVLNNPSSGVKKILNAWEKRKKTFSLEIITIDNQNLALARNKGVKKSTRKNILFMDSDCVFLKNTLRDFSNALRKHSLVSCKITFEHGFGWSKLSSKSWDYFYDNFGKNLFYTPGAAINKKLFLKLGGFNPKLLYCEDAYFSRLLVKLNKTFFYLPKTTIRHKPITLALDIKSQFKYILSRFNILRAIKMKNSLLIFRRFFILGLFMFLGYIFAPIYLLNKVN